MRLYDTNRWRKLRLQLLRDNPLCVRCSNKGLTTSAECIDHCIPHRVHDFWDINNLFSLCTKCHSEVTGMYDNFDCFLEYDSIEEYAKVKYGNVKRKRSFKNRFDEFGFKLPPMNEKLKGA